jgi:uncharacterized membrane protein YdjX (TVP38/TMEM64 family)
MRGTSDLGERGDVPHRSSWPRWVVAALFLAAIGSFYGLGLYRYFSWEYVRDHFDGLKAQVERNLLTALLLFFFVYIAAATLSLPVAGILSLLAGALFGTWVGVPLVSLASTLGATLAFLSSRYVLRDWVRHRFGARLSGLNAGVEKDGAFYLFALRLVPVFPFFLINLGMALTPMRTGRFAWVSMLGMLPATVVYVNVGRALGEIKKPGDILSPGVLISLALLGVVPLALRKLIQWRGR